MKAEDPPHHTGGDASTIDLLSRPGSVMGEDPAVRRLLVKCPYYLRSLIVLVRALEPKGRVRGLLGRGPLVFRRGFELEAPELLDLLVAKETVCDDAYRLDSLRDEAPRLIVDVGAGIGDFTVLAAWTFP